MAVIVVTGAAGALGSKLVDHLVARGDRVAALDTPRSAERLRTLEASHAGHVLGVALDVAASPEWAAARARFEGELGPAGGAVLVAGGFRGGAPLHAETDDGVYRAMMSANVDTARAALQALLPGMVARKKGSIVIIGSRAAVRPDTSANAAAYAASKAAAVALAQAVAAEVLEHGVRVNAVLPSVIDTPANRGAMPKADPSHWVEPESLARVIAFLLSDDARDISGAAIPVYGRA